MSTLLLGRLTVLLIVLKTARLFDASGGLSVAVWKPNALKKRDVLGAAMLSMPAGAKRYAHLAALRGDDPRFRRQ